MKTTKGGKVMNPTDAYRKELRKKELKRNKKERKKVREVGILKKDPEAIREQIQKLEMMKADGALDKARKHKKRQLEDTLNLVLKKRKEEAERNSQNRSMQGPTHKLGTRHVTQIRHELRERGEPIDRMSVWMASRRLDHPEVAALVAQFEARLAELPEEERQVVARRDEIFHTIIGQDGHGYTLTYGMGIPRLTIMRAESSGCSSSQGPRLRTYEVAELIQSLHQQMDARIEDLRVRMEVAMQAEVQAQVQEQVQAFKAELQQRLAQSGVPIADDSDPSIHTQAPDAGSGHQARHESVGEGMPDPVCSNEQNRVD